MSFLVRHFHCWRKEVLRGAQSQARSAEFAERQGEVLSLGRSEPILSVQ